MKLTNSEQKFALVLAKFITVILFIFIYWFRLLFRVLYLSKRAIYKLAIVILITWSALNALQMIAYSPQADAQFAYTSQNEQIISYIHQRFGSNAEDMLKILGCENHRLNPNAQNWNSDGTIDTGVMQVNSIHGVPQEYLFDWHTNVDVGYQIFKDSGFGAWTCSYVLK